MELYCQTYPRLCQSLTPLLASLFWNRSLFSVFRRLTVYVPLALGIIPKPRVFYSPEHRSPLERLFPPSATHSSLALEIHLSRKSQFSGLSR